jgi:DNA segregation ATPase FtsK/SpoIIIE, S-DNA-T family
MAWIDYWYGGGLGVGGVGGVGFGVGGVGGVGGVSGGVGIGKIRRTDGDE